MSTKDGTQISNHSVSLFLLDDNALSLWTLAVVESGNCTKMDVPSDLASEEKPYSLKIISNLRKKEVEHYCI